MTLRPLFHALVGSYLRREWGRTLLTIFGVALGIAVLVAIDLANESAVASFKRTLGEVAGEAELTIRGNGVGMDPEWVTRLGTHDDVEALEPLITGTIQLAGTDRQTTQTLTLMGTDFLRSERRGERTVRTLQFQSVAGVDNTDYFIDPTLLIVPARFLEKTGMQAGDSAQFDIAGRSRTMRIAGVIEAGPYADAFDGNLALVEIAMADHLLDRQGSIDRIDIVLREGVDVDAARARIAHELSPDLLIERPATRGEQADRMLAAFRFNLRALGHISILVGAFLVFNTMSVAVVRRRPVIGTLRAIGVSAARIRLVFLAEGLLIGVAACLIGVPLGIAMAAAMLDAVSTAISINFVQTEARGLALSPTIIATTVAVGLVGTVLAALRPAQEAAATPPANTMRRGTEESREYSRLRDILPGALAAVAGVALLFRQPTQGLPVLGYTATVLIIAAFVLWCRPLLAFAAARSRGVFLRLFGAEGMLAMSTIAGAPGRTSVAVCGLMISLGMTVSVTVMVSSFRITVIDWMEQVLLADYYIAPANDSAARRPEPLPASLADELARIPGVRSVDPFRVRTVTINGMQANLGAGDLSAARFGNRVRDGRAATVALLAARDSDSLIVSEAFAAKHRVAEGEVLSLPIPGGVRDFRIEAVYYDYSSEQGYAFMDRRLYVDLYDDPLIDNMAVYLDSNIDRELVMERIDGVIAATPDLPRLVVRANTDLRAFALEAFDQTFAITTILKVIAIVVSILGVAATLLAQVLDRIHEIITLRTLGASRWRVVKVILLESSFVALAGLVLGTLAGLIMSWILTRVIMMESFGWTIRWSVPPLEVAQAALLVGGCTILAAILPAREAVRWGAGAPGR